MRGRLCPARRGWHWCLLLLLLLSSCTDDLQARKLHEDAQQQPLPQTAPVHRIGAVSGDGSSTNANTTSTGSSGEGAAAVDAGSAIKNLFKNTFKNQTLKDLPWKDMLMPLRGKNHSHSHDKHNFTMSDLLPKNFSMKETVKTVVANITNGMSAIEFAKALMTGTISANTADTNTPDKGLSDVQSGAININPFVDGAALSNALTLAGRDATANSRGLVFGMVGTGRSSSQATALGMSGAKASTDTFTINGGGFSQNSMGSNLAATPQGRADTSLRSAAFNIIGHTATGGITTAFGKKGAASAGLGAGMTGLGESYSSQFADSISQGDTSSNVGVIAGTLSGAAKGTVGSVSISSKKSAESQALSTSKSALGSATSKSASLSAAAQNATSRVSSTASTGVGNVDAISSTTSTGMNAKAYADSVSTSQAGAANSRSHSKAVGVTSAESASSSSTHPYVSRLRDTLVLRTQRKRPSTTWTTSRSSSSTMRAGTTSSSWLHPMSRFVPPFLQHTQEGPATTVPLLGEALVSSAVLKALLPAVPKIHPQLPTFNQTVEVNNTAQVCNETEINFNRTADMPRLHCNATSNSTNITDVTKKVNPTALPGIGFFKNLQDMNDKFMADNKNGTKPSSSAAQRASVMSQKGFGASGGGAAPDAFATWTRNKEATAGGRKPPNKGKTAQTKARYSKPIGPQLPQAAAAAEKPEEPKGGKAALMGLLQQGSSLLGTLDGFKSLLPPSAGGGNAAQQGAEGESTFKLLQKGLDHIIASNSGESATAAGSGQQSGAEGESPVQAAVMGLLQKGLQHMATSGSSSDNNATAATPGADGQGSKEGESVVQTALMGLLQKGLQHMATASSSSDNNATVPSAAPHSDGKEDSPAQASIMGLLQKGLQHLGTASSSSDNAAAPGAGAPQSKEEGAPAKASLMSWLQEGLQHMGTAGSGANGTAAAPSSVAVQSDTAQEPAAKAALAGLLNHGLQHLAAANGSSANGTAATAAAASDGQQSAKAADAPPAKASFKSWLQEGLQYMATKSSSANATTAAAAPSAVAQQAAAEEPAPAQTALLGLLQYGLQQLGAAASSGENTTTAAAPSGGEQAPAHPIMGLLQQGLQHLQKGATAGAGGGDSSAATPAAAAAPVVANKQRYAAPIGPQRPPGLTSRRLL